MNKILLSSALIAALAVNSVAGEHEWELNGVLKNETSVYTSAANTLRNSGSHSSGELMKMENSINLFINGELSDNAALHIQANLIHDNEGVEDFRAHRAYTQHDYLREFYIDTMIEDSAIGSWDIRLGKQQVVWGTADGVKFLDIINPTDYREWGQNTMEDSRIPLWMVTAETSIGDDSSLQLVWVPDIQINQISGLINTNGRGDAGQPFVSLGADTLTGSYNGFLNIAPELGQTAGVFQSLLQMGGLTGLQGGPMSGTTVQEFTQLTTAAYDGIAANLQTNAPGFAGSDNDVLLTNVFLPLMKSIGDGATVLNTAANQAQPLFNNFVAFMGGLQAAAAGGDAASAQTLGILGNLMYANVAAGMGLDATNPASMAIVAANLGVAAPVDPTNQAAADTQAFGQAVQGAAITGLDTQVFNETSTNLFNGTFDTNNKNDMFDYMGDTLFETFYSFQNMTSTYRQDHENSEFSNHNLGLRFKSTAFDSLNYSLNYYYHWENNPFVDVHWEDTAGNRLAAVQTDVDPDGNPATANMRKAIQLQTTTATGAASGIAINPYAATGGAVAVFTERMNRVHSIGTSMDYAIETPIAPMVLRGEFLYDKDSMTTVIDKAQLAIGDLEHAIIPTKADFFKYVLGADITLFTNLFVSAQYMETRNLDFVDESSISPNTGTNFGRYTANSATMALSNGLKKAEEVQRMYTLFFSKPFLESDALRVNNITLLEGEDSGIWNRLDAEYTYSDEILLTAEYNYYGGDENGIFGQFEDSSSVQVGFKYIF